MDFKVQAPDGLHGSIGLAQCLHGNGRFAHADLYKEDLQTIENAQQRQH
jgi:hypothetical protein